MLSMIVRVAPRGFVHEVREVRLPRDVAATPVLVFACKQVRTPANVTTDFPRDSRRCHRCFPGAA